MVKIILGGNKAKEAILEGMKEASDAVSSTLGPCGYTVISEKSYGAPKITKDGVSVINELDLEKPKNMGVDLLKEAASRSDSKAGDGTTTTTLLAYTMATEGVQEC